MSFIEQRTTKAAIRILRYWLANPSEAEEVVDLFRQLLAKYGLLQEDDR